MFLPKIAATRWAAAVTVVFVTLASAVTGPDARAETAYEQLIVFSPAGGIPRRSTFRSGATAADKANR